MRIKIESDFNKDYRTFHTTVEISKARYASFERPLRESSNPHLEKIGELGKGIIKGLMRIDGIVEVEIKPYLVRVQKGPAFEWVEITPRVLDVLAAAFAVHVIKSETN